ncbi:TPA: ATP-dependent RNA helicase HrpA [Salmonella enterica subsp. enterica serovar Infantis]
MTEQSRLTLQVLQQRLDALMLRDKQRFSRRLHGVKKVKNPDAQQAIFQTMAKEIEQAATQVALREAARPSITYPQNLPVSQKKQDILEAIRDHQVVIVAGETGSGKTTQLPKICMELGRGIKGLIGHTQPRRLAARTVANRIAEELQTEPGGCIGYKVRFSDHVSSNTMVKLMTDGILLAEIQQDRLLMQYDTIIIDEAHERSLNIDFLLGYLKELLPRRPDLKVIITSATIDPERFSRHFNNAPIIEVSGRTYPVEVRYRPIVEEADDTERDQLQAIFDAVDELGRESPGDILIFMSGEREIRDTADALNKLNLRHTEVLPLYARLSNSEQNRVFQSHSGRRIVLATNVAETSLTVPGIKYVIDPGTARISRYSYRTKVQRLPIEPISQASDEKHRRFHDKESDFLAFVNLWNYLGEQQKALSSNQFRRLCRTDYLNYLRVREWQDIYTQLRQVVKELGIPVNSEPAEYREIHVALLTGLLSHIGMKDADKQEYTGARNARFSIFPGSGLFKKPPKWTMVAELVETSRLWGRIAARIEPEWVEPVAQHLIKRSYSEPHWERAQGAVMATEKVTVYGLPIVAARKVNYSQIDPALCRELFIRHALVEGDWQTRHAFFRENLKLRAEVEELEHKSRRRDILVDDDTLFEFYDQRISHDVISARHFDSWWKKISRETPDLLNFEKSMLIKEGAEKISKLDYPNFWHQGNLKLRLSYQFEPGADADGVTVHIPLPLLNQVDESGFEWQIPGLRRELVIALIKSLPKPVRRNFVPAPNYAEAFLGRVTPLELPLLDALERELRRMTGVTVDREDWHWDQVPEHLKITFRVVNDKNKKLQEGRSLAELKNALKGKVQETLSAVADDGIEQSGLHIWSFGELPESYEQKRGNYKVKAWPALVDERDSVAIKLFDNPLEQQQAMWCGLRRLLLLNIPSPIKYLHEKLPNKAKLGLYFNPYGKVLELIDDCIACGVDKLIDANGGPVWSEAGFTALHEKVRAELNDTVVDIAKQVERILTTVFNINKRLKGRVDMSMALGLSDIKAQMSGLVYRGFVTGNGFKRLGDTLRYLQAIEKRLEKLAVDPHRDRAQMLKVESVQQAWQQWINKLPPARREDDDVKEIRWMIEELRVSYFAQQLGTPYPISDKRILQAMDQITA